MATAVRQRIENASIPEPNSGCWLWLGNLNHNGYGTLAIKVGEVWRTVRAHRASYEAFVGPIPSELDACHSCDNRACVNPAHIFPGTRQQNVDDCLAKGRNGVVRGSRNGQAKIDETTARLIHARLRAGEGPAAISRAFSVSLHICKNISKGKGWQHLAAAPPQSGEGEG
jgi:hypothetical protein